jgi:hypothetical protein
MTVCIATLAERSKAIVLVSDKAVTYGDGVAGPAMQDDTDVQKMLPLVGSQWMTLTAGTGWVCDSIIRSVESKIRNGRPFASALEVSALFEESYREHYDKMMDKYVFQRMRLTRPLWAERSRELLPLPDSVTDRVSKELRKFSLNCALLICGFDPRGKANILSIDAPGIVANETNEGFSAIGSGADTATGRLLWQGFRRRESLEVVLYKTFDAKAHAELIDSVGYDWDGCIMVRGYKRMLNLATYRLVASVFEDATKSPFVTTGRKPRRWKFKLSTYCRNILRRARR